MPEGARKSRSEYFKKWYEENKERVQAKKAQRYKEDEAVRERAKARATEHYWTKRRPIVDEPKRTPIPQIVLPEATCTVNIPIRNPLDIRCGTVIEVPAYTTGYIAEITDRLPQTVRVFISEDIIPDTTIRNNQNYRLYTRDQMLAIASCAPLLNCRKRRTAEWPFKLQLTELWDQMPDGVVPAYSGLMMSQDRRTAPGIVRPIIGEGSVWFTPDGSEHPVEVPRTKVKY